MSDQSAPHERYVEWLRRAASQRRPVPRERVAHGWRAAREAAQLLRKRHGAARVRVFGSLLHPEVFHANSDVDLAVEGLAAGHYWDALADLLFLDEDVTLDLVEQSSCPAELWTVIEREGLDI